MEVPIDADMVVFKGSTREIGTPNEGGILKFKEFTATSLNEQTALNFVKNESGKKYIYEIHVPQGINIIPILQQGRFPNQSEILFSEEHTFVQGDEYPDPNDEGITRVPLMLIS